MISEFIFFCIFKSVKHSKVKTLLGFHNNCLHDNIFLLTVSYISNSDYEKQLCPLKY